jgi:hypothetical protein
MTSKERKQVRYVRRKAEREARRTERIAPYDNYDRITDPDNLYQAFKSSQKGVSWKESIQRYEASALRNIS